MLYYAVNTYTVLFSVVKLYIGERSLGGVLRGRWAMLGKQEAVALDPSLECLARFLEVVVPVLGAPCFGSG